MNRWFILAFLIVAVMAYFDRSGNNHSGISHRWVIPYRGKTLELKDY